MNSPRAFSNTHFAGIVNGFPSTILPLLAVLGQPTSCRKGVDTSGRTTPKVKRITCVVPHRVEPPSEKPIDGVILRLDLVIICTDKAF